MKIAHSNNTEAFAAERFAQTLPDMSSPHFLWHEITGSKRYIPLSHYALFCPATVPSLVWCGGTRQDADRGWHLVFSSLLVQTLPNKILQF
ncbi:MAG: hypothetical protein ACYSWO_13815, partial [Planctomycetota bacterium]